MVQKPRASSPLWCIIRAAVFLKLLLGIESSKRDEPQLRYKIQEESPKGMHVCNLIEDARLSYSVDVLSLLRFRFLTEPNTLFDIGANTGVITTAAVIDRDSTTLCRQRELCEVSLDVVIQPSQHFQILKVIVEIVDINDNAPKFRESRITLPINEAAVVGSAYIVPTASDTDSPTNGVQRYELDSVSNKFGLQINPKLDGTLEVKLVLKAKLDRETESEYQLKLMAYDGGSGSLAKTGTLTIDVVVQDSNDNRPAFVSQQYEASVTENLPIGSTILQVLAVDQDAGPNGLVGYSFATQTQSLHGQLFGINNLTGEIVVRGVVDHEKSSVYQLVVIAQDHGPDTLSSEVTVIVHVDDLNDNSPSVTFHTLSSSEAPVAEILEDSTIGAFVAHISVIDRDSGANGRVNCTINEKVFSLMQKYATEYQIVTATMLDRERTDQYFVTLKCQDGGPVPRAAEKTLRVVVIDVNDNAPVFDRQIYTGSLTENNHPGTSVLQVTASDWDEGNNAAVQYSLPPDVAASFHVDQRGVISAHELIDRETHGSFRFPVYAVDMGSPPRTGSALVIIDVKDVNDERPSFSQSSFMFSVAENEPPETEVGFLSAEDRDNPPYNNFLFAVASDGAIADVFSVDPTSGAVRTRKTLDREAMGLYQFVVMVYDPNMSSMTNTASVSVRVLDRNDNTPEFVFPSTLNNSVQISSYLPVGHAVTQVLAIDADTDENAKLSFKVLDNRNNNGTFKMETNRVVVAARLPLVDFRVYQLTIQALDHGNPSRSTSATLYIHVNQSIPFKGFVSGSDEDDSDQILSSYNLVIVIGIGSGCAIVVLILVIAIFVVRQKDKRRHIRKYNCRMEALRMLTTKESQVCSSSPESSPRKKMLNGSKPLMKKEATATECKAMIPQATTDVHEQQTTVDNNQQTMSKSWHSNKDVEVHPWIHSKTGIDVDKDSVHSVEGSVTDSGRGPSEEGEAGHIKHNRERYLPPPPPPPRGAYWLQQQKTSTPPTHPTVRFQGLSSTPEESVDASDSGGMSTTYQERTFQRPSLQPQHPYSSNSSSSSAASPRYTKTVTMQPHDLHHAPIKPAGYNRLPAQPTGPSNRQLGPQATLDQLSRRKATLDQLSKLDTADPYKRSQTPTYDRMFSKPKDCVYSQSTLEKNSVIVGHDVIV